MSSGLRIGIAGYGATGRIRRMHIDPHRALRTVAVCDRDFATAHEMEDGVRAYPTYQELLANEELDVLFVCLPNFLSPDATIAGLRNRLHVFCEKPPGRTVEDIRRVREYEAAHPESKLMYGFNHRYHYSVRDALGIIRSGELGEVLDLKGVYGKSKMIRFDTDWRTKRAEAGGGILLDQGIHMLDLMRLFGGEFTDVSSHVSNNHWNHDVEDNAYALMRTDNGVVALLHSSATQWRHRFHLEITLERGALILSGILSSTKSYGAETLSVVYAGENDQGDPREVSTRYNEDNSWRDEIADFAEAILTGRKPRSGSSAEALRTMELVYRIYGADRSWAQRYGLAPAEEAAAV